MAVRAAEMSRLQFGGPQFGQQFDRACRDVGFLAVTDVNGVRAQHAGCGQTSLTHSSSIEALKSAIYTQLDAFAALPTATKNTYHVDPTGQRGYTPAASEAQP